MWWVSAVFGSGIACAILVPLALKWRLPLRVVVLWALLTGAALGVAVQAIAGLPPSLPWVAAHVAAVIGTSAAAGAAMFFRDPERHTPDDALSLVSPAEGEICYVRTFGPGAQPPMDKRGRRTDACELGDGPREHGIVIGIAMHLLNVHVNRSPIAGTVSSVTHSPGRFLSLKRPEAVAVNERMTTVIENDHARVAVVQIASRLVRRIVSYVDRGIGVAAGQRIGMIKFGSQVDLVLFDLDVDVCVRPGDRVRAGETVLARLVADTRTGQETRQARPADAFGRASTAD